MKQSGVELVARYRTVYALAPEVGVTEAMVREHWELERSLRQELLAAGPGERWATFERCYASLYRQLPWLTGPLGTTADLDSMRHELWSSVLGDSPLRVYEVGSGRGSLIHDLATRGFRCTGTEITRERGSKWVPRHENLTWHQSDGVHLDRFEPACHYDAVISDQVVEHIHPDDLVTHFTTARGILKRTGRYICTTPHASLGPSDVSYVFRARQPEGMHLREYTYREITAALHRAGFGRVESVFRLPARLRLLGSLARARPSTTYLRYLLLAERLPAIAGLRGCARPLQSVANFLFFPRNIMVVATA